MDTVNGEKGGLYRLTDRPWDDTMATWSPNGDWIAFSSDRENPGSGSFALYMIHPNGTGLKKLLDNRSGGRINHPCFSLNRNSIMFTFKGGARNFYLRGFQNFFSNHELY